MALKAELVAWGSAVEKFDQRDFDGCLDIFEQIANTAKIHFNIAIAFMNMDSLDDAISALTRAIAADPYYAAAYFQRGACLYRLGALDDAVADFTDTIAFMRNNLLIDYTQLGLAHKLFACEAIYNRGLCNAALGKADAAMQDFDEALRTRPTDNADFSNIEQAIRLGSRAPESLGAYEIPRDLIYRPPVNKMKNAERVDYLGTAKVVAAVEVSDNYAGFSGKELV
ncbi:hypothetical protein BDK51DRAFT_29799, partial [Blyttiomyces helicus]